MSRKKISFGEAERLTYTMMSLPGLPEAVNRVAGAIVSSSVVYDVDVSVLLDIMNVVIKGTIEEAESNNKIKMMREAKGKIDEVVEAIIRNQDFKSMSSDEIFKRMFGDDVKR